MSIYNNIDYRKAIKFLFQSRKKLGQKITYQRLAEELQLQKSHFSQILSGTAEMNHDHMFLLVNFFELDKEKINYMHLLLEYSRTSLQKRKKEIKTEIQNIQKTKNLTQEYLQVKTQKIKNEVSTEFFLDPYNQLVFLMLKMKIFKKNPQSIALAINISTQKLERILLTLNQLGLVDSNGKEILISEKPLHLSKETSVFPIWSSQMRQLAIHRSLQNHPGENYNFSVFFTGSEKIRTEIQQNFFEFIKEAQKLSASSKKESIFQLNFDLLKWI
ncbi:MAG: TIGR02147 family protein [Bdellovibrionaceae bacterium]|jgi:uncharacterized protein (TIGR02147 family)|nr:TIGR02147 family protein [Pseudobdellovibrionaceae bacterium]